MTAFGRALLHDGRGGNAMMYVNLIWIWGHPEVYIIVLPAFGVFSEVWRLFRNACSGTRPWWLAMLSISLLSVLYLVAPLFHDGSGAEVNLFFAIIHDDHWIPTA